MFWKTINKIKSGYHHNMKFIIVKIFKNELQLINIFIKLGVIKTIIKKKNKSFYIQFNYKKNKKIFQNIINLHKPSHKKYIKLKTLKHVSINKNWILILSTPKGVITNIEAVKYNIGGLILAKIWN